MINEFDIWGGHQPLRQSHGEYCHKGGWAFMVNKGTSSPKHRHNGQQHRLANRYQTLSSRSSPNVTRHSSRCPSGTSLISTRIVGTVSLQNVIMGPSSERRSCGLGHRPQEQEQTDNTRKSALSANPSTVELCPQRQQTAHESLQRCLEEGQEWARVVCRGVDNIRRLPHRTRSRDRGRDILCTSLWNVGGDQRSPLHRGPVSMEALLSPEEMHATFSLHPQTPRPHLSPRSPGNRSRVVEEWEIHCGVSGKYMGTFRDFESAVAHRKAHVAMVQSMNGSPPLTPTSATVTWPPPDGTYESLKA
jgi:hypothetical protein